jgi:hypothetical protein
VAICLFPANAGEAYFSALSPESLEGVPRRRLRARRIGSFIRRRSFFWRLVANVLRLLLLSHSESVA